MAGLLVLNTGKTKNQFDYISNIQNILLNSHSLKWSVIFWKDRINLYRYSGFAVLRMQSINEKYKPWLLQKYAGSVLPYHISPKLFLFTFSIEVLTYTPFDYPPSFPWNRMYCTLILYLPKSLISMFLFKSFRKITH